MAASLDPALADEYRKLLAALPPLTDAQLDAVCETLAAIHADRVAEATA